MTTSKRVQGEASIRGALTRDFRFSSAVSTPKCAQGEASGRGALTRDFRTSGAVLTPERAQGEASGRGALTRDFRSLSAARTSERARGDLHSTALLESLLRALPSSWCLARLHKHAAITVIDIMRARIPAISLIGQVPSSIDDVVTALADFATQLNVTAFTASLARPRALPALLCCLWPFANKPLPPARGTSDVPLLPPLLAFRVSADILLLLLVFRASLIEGHPAPVLLAVLLQFQSFRHSLLLGCSPLLALLLVFHIVGPCHEPCHVLIHFS